MERIILNSMKYYDAFMAEASKWIAFSVLSQIKLDVVLGPDKSSPNHLLEYWRLTSDGREQ